MEFPELLQKWIFWVLIKSNMEFPEVIKKKSCEIPRGLDFRPEKFCGV